MNNCEKRWHPLLHEWVILAQTRNNRPRQGSTVEHFHQSNVSIELEQFCYLCPGSKRALGQINPQYDGPWVFTNDFSAFSIESDSHGAYNRGLERSEPAVGLTRVVCYGPQHNKPLSDFTNDELLKVVHLWTDEFLKVKTKRKVKNVLIFENKGKMVGASSMHPHSQVYSTDFVPKNVKIQRKCFSAYYKKNRSHLLLDILASELQCGKRIIYENEYFVSFVPFFARLAYETYIVPRRHVKNILELSSAEQYAFADILRILNIKFDNLFDMNFPNSMIIYNAPTEKSESNNLFGFHIEFYPPLLSKDKIKYIAGFDLGCGNILNSVDPNEAAEYLRASASNRLSQINTKNKNLLK